MSSLERLPPDQRAVLALVLQRGRSYDEIANLLAIDRAAVRDRALSALDALGPSESRVPPERRALITDYLLGQLPDRLREETRERLASSPGERTWARLLADELAPMATKSLPEIPAGAPAAPPAEHPEPAHTPEPAEIPELGAAMAGAASPASPASPAAATPKVPPARRPAPGPQRPAGGDLSGSGPPLRSSSRSGGGALLALALLVVVVAVVIVVITNSGSSTPKPKTGATTTSSSTPATTSTPTGTTTGTSTSPHIISQIIMRPPSGAGKTKPAGLAEIVTEGSVTGVIVAADHLTPNTIHNAYAIWLANPGGTSHLLGYVRPGVSKKGTLKTSGPLPANVASYKEILITLETTSNTKAPGPTVLRGAVSLG